MNLKSEGYFLIGGNTLLTHTENRKADGLFFQRVLVFLSNLHHWVLPGYIHELVIEWLTEVWIDQCAPIKIKNVSIFRLTIGFLKCCKKSFKNFHDDYQDIFNSEILLCLPDLFASLRYFYRVGLSLKFDGEKTNQY